MNKARIAYIVAFVFASIGIFVFPVVILLSASLFIKEKASLYIFQDPIVLTSISIRLGLIILVIFIYAAGLKLLFDSWRKKLQKQKR